MKKKKLSAIIKIGRLLGGIFFVSFFAFLILYFMIARGKGGMYLSYNKLSCQIAYSDNYVAYWDQNRIIIEKHDGTEISTFIPDEKGIAPNQIVLGREGYYLLEWDYLKTGNALITQLDYQSNIRKQIKRKNVAILTCKNGVLFIGEWVANARILPNYLDGFYANYFIEETKFGEDFSGFNFEKESVVCVAGTSLYRHSQGYFCTEPEFDGYLGMDSNVVQVEKRTELLEKSESKREFMNLKMLFKKLDWKKGDTCKIMEYQKGSYIFGVCSFFDDVDEKENKSVFSKDNYAVFYKINCVNNSIDILSEKAGIGAILSTKDYILYYTDKAIIREQLNTGKIEELIMLSESEDIRLEFQTGIFQVSFNSKHYNFYWDQSDCMLIR